MSHSKVKIQLHGILVTKNREPFIIPGVKSLIHQTIFNEFTESGCFVDTINGMPDHVHVLFYLNPGKSIAEVIKQVKGASSHTINLNNWLKFKFSWQPGYAAFSVSGSSTDAVRTYIKTQEEHHAKMTFEQEYQRFMELYGLKDE